MKTIDNLNGFIAKEGSCILHERGNVNSNNRDIKKAENKIVFYRFCIKYLEFNPNIAFCKSEQLRIHSILERIKLGKLLHTSKDAIAEYLKETEYKKYAKQFKCLDFLNS